MSRADRVLLQLLVAAMLAATAFAVPVAITLFPGDVQRFLHGSGEFGLACAAAVYAFGSQLPPLGVVVLALALASAALGALRLARTLARTRGVLERACRVTPPARLARAAACVGVSTRVVCVADRRPYAYCAGLLRPRIFVSVGAVRRLRRLELEAVLLHEAAHLRRRDPLRLLVARVLAAALFAAPWLRVLAARLEVAVELDADGAATAVRGTAPLAGALWKLSRAAPPFPAAQLAVGAWSVSRARISQLCGASTDTLLPRASGRARWITAASLALALALTLGQAARANLMPASALDRLVAGADERVHLCPVPVEGVLL